MPYDPNYADENYSYEYGGYIDNKRQGFGFRGRGFGGRPPMGSRGRYVIVWVMCYFGSNRTQLLVITT